MNKTLVLIVILFLSLAVRLIILNDHVNNLNYPIQQDGYADYAVALKEGTLNSGKKFSLVETRLFPGYPMLIFASTPIFKSEINAGLAISLISSIIAIILFWNLSKSLFATGIFAFFPPVWVLQSTKVSTEPISVLLLLLSIILFKRKNFLLTGIFLGLAFDIKLISICLFLVLLLLSIKKYSIKSFLYLSLGFLITVLFLFFYNYLVFGMEGIFKQFQIYYSINRVSIGFVQIVQDVFRAIDWKQYRILLSGLFYLLINLFALFQLHKHRNTSLLYQICFFWMLFSLIFVFLLGPTPLLEEFARFSVPFVPALIFGIFSFINNIKINKFLKR